MRGGQAVALMWAGRIWVQLQAGIALSSAPAGRVICPLWQRVQSLGPPWGPLVACFLFR